MHVLIAIRASSHEKDEQQSVGLARRALAWAAKGLGKHARLSLQTEFESNDHHGKNQKYWRFKPK
jgi:hypothetical protein